ncbi:PREDICTED: uncharacterized protein LOC108555287 [Eufriesea mexicana]|uniref:uncharacterized protein LOC108555287 n=1 Tax=Eufriesea mexicana TaxID=516756 RepID=UPI00083C4ABB|nr:PREDICTED: uncharacterized protein LOC108555287 [Eufriesea mexicana]
MQVSSMNLLVTGLSLLCLANPLHSDLRGSHWPNYEFYNPVFPVPHQLHGIPELPGRYISPSVREHPTRYGETRQTIREIGHFDSSLTLSYPERLPETVYLQPDVSPSYHEFGSSDHLQRSKLESVKLETEDTKPTLKEEEIAKKMRILDKLLSEDPSEKDLEINGVKDRIITEESKRVVRAVKKHKPGFFWTLAKITFESINDTRSAIKQISEMINNSIASDSATQSSMMSGSLTAADSTSAGSNVTTVNNNETTTTTQAPAALTRSGLQSLIRRNVLGLVRLFNIEWKDALNQSETNVQEFQRDLGNQVGSYLRDNPKAY